MKIKVKKHCVLHDLCQLSAGGCCSKLIYTCNATAIQLPSAAISFCCPGVRHRFYLEGGEEDVNFCHTSPRALLLSLCPCLFCSRDVIGLDGWKQFSQKKPGDTDTLCQVRCVHRSDGDAKSLWFCIRFQLSLAQSLSYREMWPRLQLNHQALCVQACVSISL